MEVLRSAREIALMRKAGLSLLTILSLGVVLISLIVGCAAKRDYTARDVEGWDALGTIEIAAPEAWPGDRRDDLEQAGHALRESGLALGRIGDLQARGRHPHGHLRNGRLPPLGIERRRRRRRPPPRLRPSRRGRPRRHVSPSGP